MSEPTPDEAGSSPRKGVNEALALLGDAYRSRLRRSGQSPEHSIAVANLLAEDRQPPTVVVVGLLHDVLEDTDVTPGELSDAFGPRVACLVQALTEDGSVSAYPSRKALLRAQIIKAGPEAAIVSLADKLDKLCRRTDRPRQRKLDHYWATLEAVEQRYGRGELSARLRSELNQWPRS